jgi:hypothetical protein
MPANGPGRMAVSVPSAQSNSWGLRFLVLALSSFVPAVAPAQRPAPFPSDVDLGLVLPLNMKPGCWQVRIHAVNSGSMGQATMDVVRQEREKGLQDWLAKLTPSQRAAFEAEGGRKNYDTQTAAIMTESKKAEAEQQKGGDNTGIECSSQPFSNEGQKVYGSNPQKCSRTIQAVGEHLHAHIVCPVETFDYERIDAENFKGIVLRTVGADAGTGPNAKHLSATQTESFVAKWVYDEGPHMPYANPPTDLNGVRARGAKAVIQFDPNRIVASFEGNYWTAWQIFRLCGIVPRETLRAYSPRLDIAVQQAYVHRIIADQAVNQGLAEQETWKAQLQRENIPDAFLQKVPENFWEYFGKWAYDADSPDPDQVRLEGIRQQILWSAYFSRAGSDAEKRALAQKLEQKYKITVVDPDFFTEPTP